MMPDPENAKARLDKALADIRRLQEKLNTLTPEQREKVREKLRTQLPQLMELKKRLEAAATMLPGRNESIHDRISAELASRSPLLPVIRKLRSKDGIFEEWGNGWLIPPQFMGRKASIKQGKSIAKFWSDVLAKTPAKRPVLESISSAWSSAPTLVLPALTTQISSLIIEAIEGPGKQTRMPFEIAAQIVKRIFVEVQLQAGMDPATTDQLEVMLDELSKAAGGQPIESDAKTLALKAMVLYTWLAFGLPENALTS